MTIRDWLQILGWAFGVALMLGAMRQLQASQATELKKAEESAEHYRAEVRTDMETMKTLISTIAESVSGLGVSVARIEQWRGDHERHSEQRFSVLRDSVDELKGDNRRLGRLEVQVARMQGSAGAE